MDVWCSGSEGSQRERVFSITSLLDQPRARDGDYYFEKHSRSNFMKGNLEPICTRHCQKVLSFLGGSGLEAYSQVKVSVLDGT